MTKVQINMEMLAYGCRDKGPPEDGAAAEVTALRTKYCSQRLRPGSSDAHFETTRRDPARERGRESPHPSDPTAPPPSSDSDVPLALLATWLTARDGAWSAAWGRITNPDAPRPLTEDVDVPDAGGGWFDRGVGVGGGALVTDTPHPLPRA